MISMAHLLTRRAAVFAAALALLLTTAPGRARAQWGPQPARSSLAVREAYRDVVAAPSRSTVRVTADGKDVALGAVVSADGYIVTKASQLPAGAKVVVRFGTGKELSARVVGVEDRCDLAMLKVEAKGLRPIAWADSKNAEAGDLLASPDGTDVPVAVGVVSVATREPSAREMTLMAPNPRAGFMGVVFSGDGRALVDRVLKDGPADRAGLKRGDVILRVAGAAMRDSDKVIATIHAYKAGDVVTLRVRRSGEEKTVKVTLERRPGYLYDRSDEMNTMGSQLSGRRWGFPVILQHDTVIKPTDCGGPLVGLDGKAVGINIARAGRTESYAIPAEKVQSLLSDLKSGKLAPTELVDDAKIAELETLLVKVKAAIKRDEAALDDEFLEADKQKELKERLGRLNKRLIEAQSELNRLRGDPTKRAKE